MLITKKYAKQLIRQGRALPLGFVLDNDKHYMSLDRMDIQRTDHYLEPCENNFRSFHFDTIDQLDNFVETFGDAVTDWDRVTKTAWADVSESDYDFWCDTLPDNN